MKILRPLSSFVLVASLLALIGSFPIRASYASRAKLIQRVQKDAGADSLFGDANGTPVGSAELMIIDDQGAFTKGAGENGALLVDEAYLKSHGEYPLQLQTVDFFVKYTRYAAGTGALVSALALFLMRRKQARAVLDPQVA